MAIRRARAAMALSLALAACTGSPQPAPSEPMASAQPLPSPATSAAENASAVASASATATADASPSPPTPPRISAAEALRALFLGEAPGGANECMQRDDDDARVRCLLSLRFSDDQDAAAAALALYDASGNVVGLNRAQTMDGGWRGTLKLVPEVPVGKHRRYLGWLLSATEDFNGFFGTLGERAPSVLRYRWQPIEIRFFRSVGRTTPSAYATDWAIAFNVSGSLHKSRDAVRETMFHEIFHLNDRDHGNWSKRALTSLYDDVLSRCTTKQRQLDTRCLTPFAPNDTMVRGGTYYAFQPGNGVWEYAAELAIRYYREQRDVIAGRPSAKPPFKCGPAPNAEAWTKLATEFFAGTDLVPPCD